MQLGRCRWVAGWGLALTAMVGCDNSVTPTSPNGVSVVSIASFFGECAGPCQRTITVQPGIELVIEDWGGGDPLAVIQGEFTALGLDERAEVNRTLGPLEARYGCPDCADGGGMRVVVERGTLVRDHEWEYGNPPRELFQVDMLFNHLHDALVRCKPTVWVTPSDDCTPFE